MDDDEVNAGGLRGVVVEDEEGGGTVDVRRAAGVLAVVDKAEVGLLSCFEVIVPAFCGDLRVLSMETTEVALSLLLLGIALLISSLFVSVVEVSVHDNIQCQFTILSLSLQIKLTATARVFLEMEWRCAVIHGCCFNCCAAVHHRCRMSSLSISYGPTVFIYHKCISVHQWMEQRQAVMTCDGREKKRRKPCSSSLLCPCRR